ncbi:MAG: polyphosphate polymerase domain-containing protein [Prolixibacteraceae bacterium]|nr:polyphosphate polymerase domain-containing protein [Prolixibacteraceae bacterium]
MNFIKDTLIPFNKVTLSDLDKVKLMNRTDQKFCLHISKLPLVLHAISADYSLLEIQDEILFQYDNTYFDTLDNQMYLSHQNGKRNRYKIRVRKYVQTDDNFLEVKFKNNKGRTIKERMERPGFETEFSSTELQFIEQSSAFSGIQLEPKIRSFFNRFTLVDNEFTERVTVDIFPGFRNHEKEITLNNLVIIEVKQSKTAKPALITQVLRENKISNQRFSKYCIGRSLLEEKIKRNNFKPLLLKLRKEFDN